MGTIGIVIPPENAAALAESIINLYEHPSERLRLADLSRAYACAYLDKDIILARLNASLDTFAPGT